MAYEYDRFEREEGGGSFLMGLLAGTVLGAGLGMLFAPRAGNELRSQLSEQANRLRSQANDTYQQATEKVSQIVERGREAYDRARTGAAETTSGTHGNTGNLATPGTSNVGTSGTTGNIGTPGTYTGAGTTNRGS